MRRMMRNLLGIAAVWAVCSAAPAGAAGSPAGKPERAPTPSASAPAASEPGADPTAPPALFRGDARLDAKVTLAEKNRPLGQLLPELGREINVRLTASPEVADDKVTLFLDQRPASESLALIAREFGFVWRPSHGGYELTQDLSARAREAALRQAGRNAQIAAIHARMTQIAALASTPPAQLEARAAEIDRLLANTTPDPAEQARLTAEQAAIGDLLRPGGAAAAPIYRSLTPAQLALLRAGGELRLSSADGSLSPSLAAAVRQAQAAEQRRQAQRDAQRLGAGVAADAPTAAPPPEAAPAGEADVSILLSTGGFRKGPPRPEGPPLQLRFTLAVDSGNERRDRPVIWWPMLSPPGGKGGSTAPPAGFSAKGARPDAGPAERSGAPGADEEAAETADPALRQTVELTFPGLKDAGSSPAAAGKGEFGPGRPPSLFFWPAGMATLADVAEAIHRATGLELIADSFIRARLDPARMTGRQPLSRIFETVAGSLAYDGKKQGRLLSFRSRLYYQDRYAEVPDSILRPWLLRVARGGAPSLDDLAGLAAALNDDQCGGLQEFWGWYLENSGIPMPPGPADFADNRQHLRFWATLSAAEKRALLAGGVLPVRQMNPLQQRAFQAALLAPDEAMPDEGGLRRGPTPAEIAAGGFSLQARQLRQQMYTGTWADGGGFMEVSRRPATDPPETANHTGPHGVPVQPAGPATVLSSFEFTYHLGGEEAPARTARIDVPGPQPRS